MSDRTPGTEPTEPVGPDRSVDDRRTADGPVTSAEALAALCFLAATIAAIALGVVYWEGGQTQLEGLLLAVILGGIGVGIVVWAKRFMPHDEVTEAREPLVSSDEDLAAFRADFEHGEQSLVGRRLLVGSLGAAATALGAALLFPIRSLGPRPGRGLKRTGFADRPPGSAGVRLVRRTGGPSESDPGEPVQPGDLAVDGVLTVWPEGHLGEPDSPTLLIRTRTDQTFDLSEEKQDWVVDGIVAYSKLCTHVGCPVGLYQAGEGLLLCPCHQSTFDVLAGAKPVFGPAARSLPQLPLDVDDDGYLIATGDFESPVGPGFWDRGRD